MGQVVALKKSLDDLVLEIRGHVHDAGRAETTCAKHQLNAGMKLIALRKAVEDGEAGTVTWWEYFDTKFTGHIKSRRYAEKLMEWARADDPEGAVNAERARVRQAMQTSRARKAEAKDESVSRDTQHQDQEYDIVKHALRLVAKMSEAERENFDEAYRREYQ